MGCENEKDESVKENAKTRYSVMNHTGSTISDLKIYELDANNATISSNNYKECKDGENILGGTFHYFLTANKDAKSIKANYKIAGESFTDTFALTQGKDREIILERPYNLTTYSMEFFVSADWDDDDYLYYVEIDEYDANHSVVQRQEYYRINGVGTITDEVKCNSKTKSVQAFFYFYPHRGEDGAESREFTIVKGEHNKFVVYGSECTFFCKGNQVNKNLTLTNGK